MSTASELTERVAACTGPAQVQAREGARGHDFPPLTKKLPPTDDFTKEREFHWVYKPHLRAGPMPRNR